MTGYWDVHCHLLPGVDDGADSLAESMRMLRMEYADGVRHMIATPHYRAGMFETPLEKLEAQYEAVCREARRELPGLMIYLGCEFYANMDMVEMLAARKRPLMGNSRAVLAEFSGNTPAEFIRERTAALRAAGFTPILAHVERYACLRENLTLVRELVGMGAYIQVNAGSILGEHGRRCRKFCSRLRKENLIHLVGSDAHGDQRRFSVPYGAQNTGQPVVKHDDRNSGKHDPYINKRVLQDFRPRPHKPKHGMGKEEKKSCNKN